MARIVYGVSGEGSGHSSRARELIAHLEAAGHSVKAASYDRGYRNLSPDFDVLEIEGLHIASIENKVSVVQTFAANLGRLSGGIRKLGELRALFGEFEPHCVITDFEPMTAYLANHYDLPLITVDNQHRIRYMDYPRPGFLKKDALVTEGVIRAMIPRPDVSLATTFYFGEVKNDRTFLLPPILRDQVLRIRPSAEDVNLVYCTQSYGALLEMLSGFPRERFLVYGFERSGSEGNLEFRPFSKEGFLSDLARCKSVLSTAGFTLITESLHLGKPLFAMPMRGQFEQELNALLLEKLGYGKNGRKATLEAIGEFFYRLPEYRQRLQGYDSRGNREIKAKLDELLADDCALARRYHRKRARQGA